MARKIEENILSALDRLEDVTQKARGEMKEREKRYHHRQYREPAQQHSAVDEASGDNEEQNFFVNQGFGNVSEQKPLFDYGESQQPGPKGELNHVLGELMTLRRQREDLEERINL